MYQRGDRHRRSPILFILDTLSASAARFAVRWAKDPPAHSVRIKTEAIRIRTAIRARLLHPPDYGAVTRSNTLYHVFAYIIGVPLESRSSSSLAIGHCGRCDRERARAILLWTEEVDADSLHVRGRLIAAPTPS